MVTFETPEILLTVVIIFTLSVIQPCGALPSSSSWIWPGPQNAPQNSDEPKDSQTKSNSGANASSSTQNKKIIFVFLGTSSMFK